VRLGENRIAILAGPVEQVDNNITGCTSRNKLLLARARSRDDLDSRGWAAPSVQYE